MGELLQKEVKLVDSIDELKSSNSLAMLENVRSFIGEKNNLIVDNYKDPKWYIASSNGKGGVNYKNNIRGLKSLTELDDLYNQ